MDAGSAGAARLGPNFERGGGPSKRALALVLVTLAMLLTEPARADGGEFHAKALMSNEVGLLKDPRATYGNAGGAVVYIPRFGVELDYALADWLEIGLAGSGTLPRDFVSDGVKFGASRNTTLYGTYSDLALPVVLRAMVWDRGTGVSIGFAGGGGPVWTRWPLRAVTTRGLGGAPARGYSVQTNELVLLQWGIDAAIVGRWRPLDWLAMEIAAYGRRVLPNDWHAGLTIGAVVVAGAGPSF